MTRFIYALKEIRACIETEMLTDVQHRLQSEAGGGGDQARQGATADPAEARRSVAPLHCRRTRPLRHQELERQALESGLGQECDGTPRLPDNRGPVMIHPRAEGRFVRRTAPLRCRRIPTSVSGAPSRLRGAYAFANNSRWNMAATYFAGIRSCRNQAR
jgi:hypothetical protein